MQTGNTLHHTGLVVKCKRLLCLQDMCTEMFFLIVFKLIKLICELLHVDYLLKIDALQWDDVIHVINAEINIDCYLIPQKIHDSLFL